MTAYLITGTTMGLVLLATIIASHVVLVRVVRRPGKVEASAFEAGHQQGYDKGYYEGHRQARPVLVSMAHHPAGKGRARADA
jgi:hypothetical protein